MELGKSGRGYGKISCTPNNMEKDTTFSVNQLQFIDSLQFLTFSLDYLVRSKNGGLKDNQ